jgi:protein ImuA
MTSRKQIIEQLRSRLRNLQEARRPARDAVIPTRIAGLAGLLPGAGWGRGTLVEWLSAGEGSGAATLALLSAGEICAGDGVLVVIDASGEFYPPTAAGWGIDLDRTIVVRPATRRDEVWAWDQALRCPAVGAVWGWIAALESRSFRRLQLAAEAGGGVGLLVRPARFQREPTWAGVRLLVEPVSDQRSAVSDQRSAVSSQRSAFSDQPSAVSGRPRRLRVTSTFRNSQLSTLNSQLFLELDDEAGVVRVVSELADPAAGGRASRA